ncbi:MAG: hypothetical protein KDH96_10320, partial [Candidatus Riesia sp.]|nr:hypothetical protein [Candidatus Riesia sp.]
NRLCYIDTYHEKLAPFMKIASRDNSRIDGIDIVNLYINQKFIDDMTSLVNLEHVGILTFSSCIFHKDLKVLDLRRFGEVLVLAFDHCNITFDEVQTHDDIVKILEFYSCSKNYHPIDIKFPSKTRRVDLINAKITNGSFDSIIGSYEINDNKIGDGDFCCNIEPGPPETEYSCNSEYIQDRRVTRTFFINKDGTDLYY